MNDNFVLYLPDNLEYLRDEISTHVSMKLEEIISFLGIKNCDKIRIIIYDDGEEFKKICKSIYPLSNIAGSFGHDNVRIFVDIEKVPKPRFLGCICHECTHLLYQNYVQEKGIQNRVIWFDEGLATNLSGEHDYELDDDHFKNYLDTKIFSDGKVIPDMAFLNVHGINYGQFVDSENKTYNGYVWSYLIVRYLIETLSKEEFNDLMRHKEKIKSLEKTVAKDAYSYYKNKVKMK